MPSYRLSAKVVFAEPSDTLIVELTVILALVSTAWPFCKTGLKRHSRKPPAARLRPGSRDRPAREDPEPRRRRR